MNNERRKKRWSPWLSLIVIGGIPIAGILVLSALPLLGPDLPRANYDDMTWTTFEHKSLGFSLDVPEAYVVDESPDGILMAYEGETIVMISHLTKMEADQRGLWADHPADQDIKLGGIDGKKFSYSHFDILFGVFTVSHVANWRDKFLALDFRTRRMSIYEDIGLIRGKVVDRDLNQVETRMLDSFTFE